MSLLKVDAITGKSDTTEVNSPITFTANTATLNSGVDLGLTANHSGVKTALNASGTAPIYACRAWVNFNGHGTVAIRSSGNVSSITDNGTGDYTVNFTTAMPDADYSVCGSSSSIATSHYSYIGVRMNTSGSTSPSAFQTSSIRFVVRNDGGAGKVDVANLSISIFR